MVGVELDNSVGQALRLESATAFTDDSRDIVITRSGGQGAGVLEVTAYGLTALPSTLQMRDNALNEIKVKGPAGSLQIERDVTIKNLGVPYHFVFDRVRVHSQTATPTLTIEKGVVMKFDDYLMIGYANPAQSDFRPGKLIAVGGTGPNEQIVFTTAKPAQAPWAGVYLFNAPGSRLENVVIEKAGAFNGIVSANCRPTSSSDNAALFIGARDLGYVPSASDFVNVTIADSASHGINAMWSGATFGPDLTAGFTFNTVGGCRQTKNNRMTGCGTEAGCLVQ
jgi:hypothetical protein